jgi:hypothetical protein
MTRSASQRCIHRKTQRKRFAAHRKKSAPSPRRRRLIRQKGRVDDTLRALLRVLSTPHRHTGGVFASCVFHSHHVRSFPSSLLLRSRHDSSTDDAAGADQGSAAEGFFATGRISGRLLESISDRKDLSRRNRATGSPERYVDRHRFVTSLRVRSSQTRDFLSSGSFRPLLLFFPDDGERFPRRRVSRVCPEDGTRGFEAPTRRKDRRRGEHRGARFFVVVRASSPRERALTCVIGSDSEYAKRPREVPI